MSFDPTPPDKNLSQGPDAFKRETFAITPARVGWGVLAIVALIFILQNGARIDFNFLWITVEQVSLWIVIVIALGLGFLLGMLTSSLRRRRRDRRD